MACGHKFPEQGSNPGPLHWELGVLAAGPPRKSLIIFFLFNISGVLHGSIPAPLASWVWSVNMSPSHRAPGSGGPCTWFNTLFLLSSNSFFLSLSFLNWSIIASQCCASFCCSVQFSSVAQSCPTLCDPMNRSTPGLPVHHQLPEFTQTQVHRVSDAIEPSHPLSSPSSPAPNPSQHQSLFQ